MKFLFVFFCLIVGSIALAESPGSSGNDGVIEGSSISSVGASATGSFSGVCVDDAVVYDNNGVQGCGWTSDNAPQDLIIRPQSAYPQGAQTPADLILAAGFDEIKVTIDDYTQCSGAVVTIECNGHSLTTNYTEASEWTAATDNNTTATSLCAALEANACVESCTATGGVSYITPALNAWWLLLTEDTATCTTVNDGTPGQINIPRGTKLVWDPGNNNDYCEQASNNSFRCYTGNVLSFTSVNGVFQPAQAVDAIGYIYNSADALELGGTCTEGVTSDVCMAGDLYMGGDINLGSGEHILAAIDNDASSPTISVEPGTGLWAAADGALTVGADTVPAVTVVEASSDTLTSILGGFKPASKTSDPCADTTNFPPGAIFYNSTSGYMCFCNNSNADIQLADATGLVACF